MCVCSWLSTSSTVCQSSSGLRITRRVHVTVMSHSATLSEAVSYETMTISTHQPTSPGSERICTLSVYGASFYVQDSSLGVRAGFTAAEATFWKGDTSVICKRAHGTRAHDHFVVTVGERHSTVTNFYVFQPPVMSSILNSNVAMHSTPSITVYGWNYGQLSTSSAMRLGGTACVNTRWISDSSMSCKPANGYFVPKAYLPIIISLGGALQRQLCQHDSNGVIQTALCQDPVYTWTQAFSYDKYILSKG